MTFWSAVLLTLEVAKDLKIENTPLLRTLRQAREKLLEVKVKDLANSGLSGTDIGEQLQQRQIEALQQFKNEFQQN